LRPFSSNTVSMAHLYVCQSLPSQFLGTPSLVYFIGLAILASCELPCFGLITLLEPAPVPGALARHR